MRIQFCPITLIIATMVAGPLAMAQQADDQDADSANLLPKFVAQIGFYDISATTEARVNALGGLVGTKISLEDDLNVDESQSTGYWSLRWRMAGRHFLELEQFNFDRSGSATLSAEINFGNQVFEIGSFVSSYFDTRVTRLSYTYLFRDTEKLILAFSAGLHITELATGISDVVVQFSEQDVAFAEVTAPLPVIGLTAGWRFTPKLHVHGRLQLFRLKIGDYTGRLDHASVKLEYDAFQHVGFGIGYDLFDLNLDIDRQHWNGSVNFRFQGPMAYVKGMF